jgi:hypothetical protein
MFTGLRTSIGENINTFFGRCALKGGENDSSHPSLSMAISPTQKL